jgi:hypothetical protein
MRLKSFRTSAWLGLALWTGLLVIECNSAAAGPSYNTSVLKPALRLKGAIDAVLETLRLKGAFDTRAAAHEKLPSEIGYADFGPLE